MKYVLQRKIGHWKDYYLSTETNLSKSLCHAKLFHNLKDADAFFGRMLFRKYYRIITVNKMELFKARLSDT